MIERRALIPLVLKLAIFIFIKRSDLSFLLLVMYRIDFQENLYDGLKKVDMITPKGKVA